MRLDKAISRAIKLILIVYGFYAVLDIGIGCLSLDSCREDMLVHHLTAFGAVFGIIAGIVAALYIGLNFLMTFTTYRPLRIFISVVMILCLAYFWKKIGGWQILGVFACLVLAFESILYPVLMQIKQNTLARILLLISLPTAVYFFWNDILSLKIYAVFVLLFVILIFGVVADMFLPRKAVHFSSLRNDNKKTGNPYPGESASDYEARIARESSDAALAQIKHHESMSTK